MNFEDEMNEMCFNGDYDFLEAFSNEEKE